MKSIPESDEFLAFTAPACNRRLFILNYLEKRGVKAVVMPMNGRDHIYVIFPREMYSPLFSIKTVIAHYDRFAESPGANDNSSSVFCLMDFAVRLMSYRTPHNIRMIFTDGEELTEASGGVSAQGAFAVATVFKRLGITNEDVYVFDCVGRGSVPVLGESAVTPNAPKDLIRRFCALKERTSSLLRASSNSFVSLPMAYSDNAGFLACGIPAVAITMLPDEEASNYMLALVKNPALKAFVTNKTVPDGTSKAQLLEFLPKTWRLFHSSDDAPASLTPESFEAAAVILDAIAALRTPAEK